jgi:hypothetical protein
MKIVFTLLLLTGLGLLSGCMNDTPLLSSNERFAQIGRNMYYEQEQLNDDIDTVLLLRPSDTLTGYNVYHRD